MRRAALTQRVAAAAVAAIVVAVVVLGGAVLARLAASTPGLLTAPGTLEGRLGGSERLVQVVDR